MKDLLSVCSTLIVLYLGALPWAAHAAQVSKLEANQVGAAIAIEASSWAGFITIQDYITDLERYGFLSKSQIEELKMFVTSQGVGLDEKPTAASVSGRRIKWGNYSATIQVDGRVKFQNGNLMSLPANQDPVTIIKMIYSKITKRSYESAFKRQFFPMASAQENPGRIDSVGAAIVTGLGWANWALVYSLVTAAKAVVSAPCAALHVPSFIKYQLKWLMFHKTVECARDGDRLGNEYKYRRLEYPSYASVVKDDFQSPIEHDKRMPLRAKSSPTLVSAFFAASCGGPAADLFGPNFMNSRSADLSSSAGTNQISEFLNDDFVKKAGVDPKKCNIANAEIVNTYINKLAKEADAKLANTVKDEVQTGGGGKDSVPGGSQK
jgi:hypothetical protein